MTTQVLKFLPGRIVATPGALERLTDKYLEVCIARHLSGDWGLVDTEDKRENEISLREGFRLLSAYPLPNDPGTFWIITEADRSVTTILLPEEY